MKVCRYSKDRNIGWDTHDHNMEVYVNPLVTNELLEDDGFDTIPKVVCLAKLWQAARVATAKKRVIVLNRAKGLIQYKPSKAYKRYLEKLKKQEEKLRKRINFVR